MRTERIERWGKVNDFKSTESAQHIGLYFLHFLGGSCRSGVLVCFNFSTADSSTFLFIVAIWGALSLKL